MSTPSEPDLRAEIETLKAELAALRKLLGVSATGSFTKATSLSPRFANLEIGPPGPLPIIVLGEGDTGGSFSFFDKDGGIMAFLGSTDEGGVLELWNEQHKYAIVAKAQNGKGMFEVCGPAGTRSVAITGNEKGGSVAIFDKPNSFRCLLTGAEGAGELTLWNEHNRQVTKLHTLEGGPMLTLIEPATGVPIVTLGYIPVPAKPEDVVIGGMLVLRDQSGNPSAELTGSNVGGNLRIFNSNHTTAIQLDSSKPGSSLAFTNPDGTGALHISGSKDGASIGLSDSTDKTRIVLTTLHDDASIFLKTPDGSPAISITAKEPDKQGIHIFTNGKQNGVSIVAAAEGGQIIVFDADNTHYIGLSHDPGLGPSLYCMDAETHQSRLTLCVGTSTNPGGLFFMSPEYTPLATLVAAPTGGQLHLYSELGIERATIHVVEDNSKLVLHTAGNGLISLAANETTTGLFTINADDDITAKWPDSDEDDDEP